MPNDIEATRRRLERLLPFILSSEKLRWQPFYVVYKAHTYSRDIMTAIVALGIAPPAFLLISAASKGGETNETGWQQFMKEPPKGLVIIVLALVLLAIVMRVYVAIEQADRRAVLARSCRNELREISLKLTFALQSNDPTSELIKLQNRVGELLPRHIIEESWPWHTGYAPGTDEEGQRRAQRLCEQFGDNWTRVAQRIERQED
jgi:hypothetical protein